MAAPDIFERPVFARARRICLAYPEAVEASAWGHPVFQAGQKTFCAFELVSGRPSIAFRLHGRPQSKVQLPGKKGQAADRFFVTPCGRNQWVSAWADGPLDWSVIAQLTERSYRLAATRRQVALLEGQKSQVKRRRS